MGVCDAMVARDCGLERLWVSVDLGGHGMGCGLVSLGGSISVGMVIGWPDWRWFGDWCLGASFFFFG